MVFIPQFGIGLSTKAGKVRFYSGDLARLYSLQLSTLYSGYSLSLWAT